MKAAAKKRWIEALRSGKFLQGQRRLRPTKQEYCCLGVLAKTEGEKFTKAKGPHYGIRGDKGDGRADVVLPKWFLAKVGLSVKQQSTLAGKNDKGQTFDQIATYIQRYVKGT